MLLGEGESTGLLYILIEGEVKILKGDFPVSTVSEPGAMFGEMSISLDTPATVKAHTACRIAIIERKSDFLQSNIEIAYQLSRHMEKRVHGSANYLVDVSRKLSEVNEALATALQHQ